MAEKDDINLITLTLPDSAVTGAVSGLCFEREALKYRYKNIRWSMEPVEDSHEIEWKFTW